MVEIFATFDGYHYRLLHIKMGGVILDYGKDLTKEMYRDIPVLFTQAKVLIAQAVYFEPKYKLNVKWI